MRELSTEDQNITYADEGYENSCQQSDLEILGRSQKLMCELKSSDSSRA